MPECKLTLTEQAGEYEFTVELEWDGYGEGLLRLIHPIGGVKERPIQTCGCGRQHDEQETTAALEVTLIKMLQEWHSEEGVRPKQRTTGHAWNTSSTRPRGRRGWR